mgnify:FL=1
MFSQLDHSESTVDREAKSSTSSWSVNLWIASAGGSSTKSEAHDDKSSSSNTEKVNIDMQCTLVTVDRSGWFNPQFFDHSEQFYAQDEKKKWNNQNPVEMVAAMKDAVKAKNPSSTGTDAFPCYPVA